MTAKTSKAIFRRRAAKKGAPASDGRRRDIDKLTKFTLAAFQGRPTPDVLRRRIPPGTTLPLALTVRERELILTRSFAPDELTRRLRIIPPPGKPPIVRLTLDDLDELGGYVAAEANHAKDRKLQREWDKIFARISAILEFYTDE